MSSERMWAGWPFEPRTYSTQLSPEDWARFCTDSGRREILSEPVVHGWMFFRYGGSEPIVVDAPKGWRMVSAVDGYVKIRAVE